MAKIYSFQKRGKNMLTVEAKSSVSTIDNVAKAFLSFDSMTHKKLQKLCYYAYAWHLTLYKQPLFEEKFQAWIHGPVAPTLYKQYKEYGWKEIPKLEDVESDALHGSPNEILTMVFNSYGHLDGDELEYLTHTESPWLEARKGLEPDSISQNELDDTTIINYYTEVFENGQND
ncbi:Panacea domain-containing protein [Bacillus safensis]|uniref:Panacea domain-containing protein n=1 Tax=Bacillus safensis TaxID=561879 RepID=UPI0019D4353F|nr:type II toxin-antitoxin system antitoxin SocA domain-containing protein [Bacillus safensis]